MVKPRRIRRARYGGEETCMQGFSKEASRIKTTKEK
jgi:hypothetical protein